MLTKFRNIVLMVMAMVFTAISTVGAGGEGITVITPETLFAQLRVLVNSVVVPLGGFLIFVSICFAGFKLIITGNKPQERSEVLASLPYIAGGGIILGAAMVLTGFILGLMEAAQ